MLQVGEAESIVLLGAERGLCLMVTTSGLLCLIDWMLIALSILLAFAHVSTLPSRSIRRLLKSLLSIGTMNYHLLIVGDR